MALTRELIGAQASLSGLSEDQISTLITLSQNDENTVIGARIGEVYRGMDDTIKKFLGVDRNGDEKTYNYLERASKVFAEKYKDFDSLKSQVQALTDEKARLEKLIKEGAGDKELQTKLDQANAELKDVKQKFVNLQKQHEEAEKGYQAKMLNMRIENDLKASISGLKFKQSFPKQAIDVLVSQAMSAVKGMNPDYIDDGQGGQRLVFRTAEGAVMNNPDNKLNPFTAAELIVKQLKPMGILDEGRPAAGGGTKPIVSKTTEGKIVVDVTGAKSRIEADSMIQKALMEQGLTSGSAEFQEAFTQARKDNNVSSLPEK